MSLFFIDIRNILHRKPFNSNSWKNWKETELTMCLRWDMTHNLTKKYKLIGLSTDELIGLLGKPNEQITHEFIYMLGMTRHGIDEGYLILTLNNGFVTGYRITKG
jgi:hypothetical protein